MADARLLVMSLVPNSSATADELNDTKIELEWFGSRTNSAKLTDMDFMFNGATTIQPS